MARKIKPSSAEVPKSDVMFAGFEMSTTSTPHSEANGSNVPAQFGMERAATQYAAAAYRPQVPVSEQQSSSAKAEPIFDSQRWPLIEVALRAPVVHLALVNPFVPLAEQMHIRAAQQLEEHEEIPGVYSCPAPQELQRALERSALEFRVAATWPGEEDGTLRQIARKVGGVKAREQGPLPCCFLAGASVLGAQALAVQPGERVLDLCAGPGAKAVVLASMLLGRPNAAAHLLEHVGVESGALHAPAGEPATSSTGLLVCNEPNRVTANLLEAALSSFLPEVLLAKPGPVVVTRSEASEKVPPALKRHGLFDKILVDPPCTAARARVGGRGSKGAAIEKDETVAKRNSELMESLLRCAGSLVRLGGLIVFTSSSLEDRENDEVVRKFVRRGNGDFEVEQGTEDEPIAGAELTLFGTLILPDQGTDHGPLYFSRIRRVR